MTQARVKKKRRRVRWGYCGCGCRGKELRLGLLYYWMYDDHNKSGEGRLFHLNAGHCGGGERLGIYNSFEQADRAVRKHAKAELRKDRAELKRLEAML